MRSAQEFADSIVHRYLTLVHHRRGQRNLIRREFDIPGRQLAVLRHIVQSGPHTVGQISRFLYVSDASTSPLLERMERAGYVTRRRSLEDSRKVLVEATDHGREIASRAPLGTIELMRTRLPGLSVEELAAIDGALERLSEVAGVDESVLNAEERQ